MRTEAGRKKKAVHDLIERGRRFVQVNQERKIQAERLLRQKTIESRKAAGKQVDEEFEIERDAINSYQLRMSKLDRINKDFKFDIDKDLDTEILINDKVFADIKDVKGLLGQDKQVNMASILGRSRKKRRK